MRKHYDIIVVGAGSAALLFLNFLKEHFDVAVFEEQSGIGVERHCTGLVSHRVLNIVGKAARKSVVNKFKRLCIMTETGAKVEIIPSNPVYVLDRIRYLKELFYNVRDKFEFHFAHRVMSIGTLKPCIRLDNGKIVYGNIIVNAEGAIHRIRRQIFKNDRKKARVYGIQMDCVGKTQHVDEFTVVFSDNYAKGFFGWVVPLDEKHVRIGIGGENISLNTLNSFISFLCAKGIVHVKEKGKPFGGIVLKTPPRWKDHYKRVVMIGDAALHVKPLTGGGLYVHALFGRKLANIINAKFEDVEYLFSKYEEETLKLRLRLKIQGLLSQVFHELTLKEKEDVLKSIGENVEIKYVDYDYHEKLLKNVILGGPRSILNILNTVLSTKNIKNLVYGSKVFLR